MGIIGGTVGYSLLRQLCPTGDSGYMTGAAYANKSKLAVLLGPELLAKVRGKVVIDFGCGPGAEAVELAQRGASRVIGVDIRDSFLRRARALADSTDVGDRCSFVTTPAEPADIIVSLDSFEHFEDPAAILSTMAKYLKPEGEIFVSFGPPWLHPLGGHVFSVFPWSHLVFTERSLLRWRKDFHKAQTATRITECGYNKMTVRRFEKLVAASPFKFAELEVRPIRKLKWAFTPLTREFVTSVVTCRLVFKSAPAANKPVPMYS